MGDPSVRHRQREHFNLCGRITHAVVHIWVGLALLFSPVSALASPVTESLAQSAVYEDPGGLFSMNVPDSFTDQTAITYQMLGDNPLDKLLASEGTAFTESESPNGVSVLFLLLDEGISDWDEFAGFLASFQVAAGGDLLPLVDLEPKSGETLTATGSAATRDRRLEVEIEARNNVVAVVSASVERTRYRELRSALADAIASFSWDPDAVLASMGVEAGPLPEEPSSDTSLSGESAEDTAEPASDDSTPQESGTQEQRDVPGQEIGALPDVERFMDADGVYSVVLPSDLAPSIFHDVDEARYGYAYFSADDELSPSATVLFVPVSFAANRDFGEPYFEAVDDELWNEFVDAAVIGTASGMSVQADERNDAYRTAFLLLSSEEGGEDSGPEMWVWVEESEGVGAIVTVVGEPDDPANAEIFHSAVTSFSWSPQRAQSAIADVSGTLDPALAPVEFYDPFGLVSLWTPPDYPFQAAYYELDSVEYTFGRNPIDGLFQLSLSVPGEGAFNSSGWSLVVDNTEQTVLDTLADGSLGRNARLVETNIGVPDVGVDNSALILARTDIYWMAVVLLDVDGVLASQVQIVPDSYYQEAEEVLAEAVSQGVDFDPDAVRDAIEASQDVGAFVLETGTARSLPSAGEEIDWLSTFAQDDSFTVAVDFAEAGMEETAKVLVFADEVAEYPLAQFALWLGEEEHVSHGKMTSQETTGTRVAFSYTPDYPLTSGEYTAYIYYDSSLVAANGFTVEDSAPEVSEIASFGPAYGNAYDGEPLLITTAVHPADLVTLRGSITAPAGSQLRLFWYDADGWLLTDQVATIRLDGSFHIPYDWIYFEPDIVWEPGTYSYLLTLDGEPMANGELLVIEDTDEVELTPVGLEFFDALPFPADSTVVPPDGFDLAVLTSDRYTERDIISEIDAWLRMQGWQTALPPIGAPVAWDYRRWTKDGYQFVVQPGTDVAEDEIWMRYVGVADPAFGPLPTGEALDTETLTAMAEVARLGIEDRFAADAAISPDGNWLAVTTTDGTLYIFDALRLMDTIWWQPNAYYADPVFSPDGRDLAVTVQGQKRSEIQLFSNFDVIWLPTTRFNGHSDSITAIDYQSDGWLASGGLDGALRQWEPTGAYLPIMVDTGQAVSGLAAAPDEAPGLLVAYDGGWLEYNLDDGDTPWSEIETLTGSPHIAVWSYFDADGVGDLAVFGEGQAEWFVYDTGQAASVGLVPADDEAYASTGAAFSSNGSLFVVSGPTVDFFDRASGDWIDSWEVVVDEQRSPITTIDLTADDQYVIVISEDGVVRMWAASAD